MKIDEMTNEDGGPKFCLACWLRLLGFVLALGRYSLIWSTLSGSIFN